MAAPADVTIKNLNGEWVMNKTISTPPDAILTLQGMGWVTRKALSYATVTMKINQYANPENNKVVNIDIDQVVTGGIKGTSEKRITDREKREHSDHIFGTVQGQSRLLRGSKGEDGKVRPDIELNTKIDDEKVRKFLRGEVLPDGSASEGYVVEELGEEHGEGEGLWLQSFVQNTDSGYGWTAEQIWGFEVIDGKRYYVRRVAVAKDGKYELGRLVYEFIKA
ncbi:hypothetical protein ASPWEDRAFT_33843 [Aspergillus wentii DTO 134E9]|uniref:Uncharacterized protein n=1 Tax=Aspergillus wentii DTO 134E9 TaxID=1073089 RepID=A0A1L9S030_ASPWE|nr:uncharacterized protein ASPWEDRAFT_33843 [Aspergillus wentii DTO 134E9]OJJ40447.1 hypothetical protein ASPWEDRAFT_33843 [Aspergillus wentii DTO 134E9]